MSRLDDKYQDGYRDGVRAATRAEDDPEPLTLDDVKAMSQDEINARWDEILPVLEAADGH